MRAIFIFVALTAFTSAAILLPADFDPTQYAGKWYEQARSKNTFFEMGEEVASCYEVNNAGGFSIDQSSVLPDGRTSYSRAQADPIGDVPGHFSFFYPDSWYSRKFPADYRVVSTDYSNYAIILSLNMFLHMEFKFAWIMTRQEKIDEDTLDQLFDELARTTGFLKYQMHRTIQ